ncbi:hypothetical protein Nepgr_021017 [Nepenthes gracilis]|uniref:Secreted protein n=1 Tax=Nepenthes gracilis TaxID=150966 RepID=A0AAD3T046_NEPGR|nr:hypothetical protein Nepgr_021017 [Nepenthes gracilis]
MLLLLMPVLSLRFKVAMFCYLPDLPQRGSVRFFPVMQQNAGRLFDRYAAKCWFGIDGLSPGMDMSAVYSRMTCFVFLPGMHLCRKMSVSYAVLWLSFGYGEGSWLSWSAIL